MALLAGADVLNNSKLAPTEMVIPGGLDWKESVYFHLKGTLPQSVYDRWIPNSDDYVCKDGDQLVTVNTDGNTIGNLLDSPHEIGAAMSTSSDIHSEALGDSSGFEDVVSMLSPDAEAAVYMNELLHHIF